MDIGYVDCHDRNIHTFKIRHDNNKTGRYIKDISLITGSFRPVHIGFKNDIPMRVLQQKISALLDTQRSRTNSVAKISSNDSRSMDKPKREKNQISIKHRRHTSTKMAITYTQLRARQHDIRRRVCQHGQPRRKHTPPRRPVALHRVAAGVAVEMP